MALFQNCLTDFDYLSAQKKYLVKTFSGASDKGEFVLPPNSRELLAFIFTIFVDIDAKRINFGEFLNKYFFIDGSSFSSYNAFIESMVTPFISAVKTLMESVIDGKLQDPIEALVEEENKRAKEKEDRELALKKEKEMLEKAYGTSLKAIKDLLLTDKKKIAKIKQKDQVKEEMTLIIDMFANVIDSEDKDAINYAFIAYKYLAKAKPFLFFNRVKKISRLIKDIVNGL